MSLSSVRFANSLEETAGGFARHKTNEVFYADRHQFITDPASWDPVPRMVAIPKMLRYADLVNIRRRFNNSFRFDVTKIPKWHYKLSATLPDLVDEAPNNTHWDSSTGRFMTEGTPALHGLAHRNNLRRERLVSDAIPALFWFLWIPTARRQRQAHLAKALACARW